MYECRPDAKTWGSEFVAWRRRHGLSLSGAAALLRVSRKAIKEWSGRRTPEAWVDLRSTMMAVDRNPALAAGANPQQRRRVPGEMTYKRSAA